MSDGMMVIIDNDGKARAYDDTYDITIHCESQEEQDEVKRRLMSEPQWIPCSERLPKKPDRYLVTVHPDYIVPNSSGVDTLLWQEKKWQFFDELLHLTEFPDPIIAWMPLPKEYKGGDE